MGSALYSTRADWASDTYPLFCYSREEGLQVQLLLLLFLLLCSFLLLLLHQIQSIKFNLVSHTIFYLVILLFVCIDHTEHVRSRRLVAHFALVISHLAFLSYFVFWIFYIFTIFSFALFTSQSFAFGKEFRIRRRSFAIFENETRETHTSVGGDCESKTETEIQNERQTAAKATTAAAAQPTPMKTANVACRFRCARTCTHANTCAHSLTHAHSQAVRLACLNMFVGNIRRAAAAFISQHRNERHLRAALSRSAPLSRALTLSLS